MITVIIFITFWKLLIIVKSFPSAHTLKSLFMELCEDGLGRRIHLSQRNLCSYVIQEMANS